MIDAAMNLTQAYSVKGFCEAFQIPRSQLYAEIRAGRLMPRKVGRRTLIRAVDAKAWVDALPLARETARG